MTNFEGLNKGHFNGSLDVGHFMGFLQCISEDESVSKSEMVEKIISNIGSHVNPYQVDKKNIITKIIESFLKDVATHRGVDVDKEVDKDVTKDLILSACDKEQLENLALYFLIKMLKNSQLNMEVNHGVSVEETTPLALVLAHMM